MAVGYPLTVHGTGARYGVYSFQDQRCAVTASSPTHPQRANVRILNQMTETHKARLGAVGR